MWLRKLLNTIDDVSDSYYDEELDDIVMCGTKEEMYNEVMQNEELHLLGTECVKKWIDTWWDNFPLYERLKWSVLK